jgi:hypothetical protein
MAGLFAQTTTTEVQRIVGDPLPMWQVLAAALALLIVILAVGLWLRSRASAPADPR